MMIASCWRPQYSGSIFKNPWMRSKHSIEVGTLPLNPNMYAHVYVGVAASNPLHLISNSEDPTISEICELKDLAAILISSLTPLPT